MAEGLLDGSLHLSLAPAPELLALPNPYDPVANASYRLFDASLYDDLYYLQWGPTPAILIFVPFQAIGIYPSDVQVTLLFAFLGSCLAIATFRFLVHRFVPETPSWMRWLGYIALVTGSALPFVLRRIEVYEVSIAAAYCFLWAGILLLLRGILARRIHLGYLAVASLCFALAFGSRVTLVLLVAPLLVVTALVTRNKANLRQKGVVIAACLGPFIFIGVLYGLYNYLRFDTPLEFGATYHLGGVDSPSINFGSTSYVPAGLWYYLIAKADLTAIFPFFQIPPPPNSYPFGPPTSYWGAEKVAGIFTNVPITVLALAAVATLWTRFKTVGIVSTSLLILASALMVLTSYSAPMVSMRYEVDFATLFVMSALLVWIMGFSLAKSRSVRIGIAVLGSAAVLWGVAFGLASGLTGYHSSLQASQPATWRALETTATPLAVIIARLQGPKPQVAEVSPPESVVVGPDPASPGRPISLRVSGSPAVVELISGYSGTVTVRANAVLNGRKDKQAADTALTIRYLGSSRENTEPAAELRTTGVTIDLEPGRNTILFESRGVPLVLKQLTFGALRKTH